MFAVGLERWLSGLSRLSQSSIPNTHMEGEHQPRELSSDFYTRTVAESLSTRINKYKKVLT